jgi:hypothetical protein
MSFDLNRISPEENAENHEELRLSGDTGDMFTIHYCHLS